MNPRFIIVVFTLLVLVFADRNTVFAQENNNNLKVPPMTALSADQAPSEDSSADRFSLKRFEAAAEGDLSLCKGNEGCEEMVARLNSLVCADDICNAISSTKNPLDCFDGGEPDSNIFIDGDRNAMALSLCALIKSPSHETRKEFFGYTLRSNLAEDASIHLKAEDGSVHLRNDLVHTTAYLIARKNSGDACINFIKDYVGPYGPNWTFNWYRVLAGCRILSYERSREELEYSFSYWYDENYCPLIVDDELRQACEAAGGILSGY